MADTLDASCIRVVHESEHLIGFRTAEEVRSAFEVLSRDGEVIAPLNCPPYMVIIGTVRDCFGIPWTLMCDFNY